MRTLTATDDPRPPEAKHGRIAVLGCGLIGGSLALAARRSGYDVVVHDLDSDALAEARDRGLSVSVSVVRAVTGADVVVIATPVDVIARVAHEAVPAMRRDAVLVDVASTKIGPMAALHAAIAAAPRADLHVIGTHPMAGSASSGFTAADPDLFAGCTWVVTPGRADGPVVDLVRNLLMAFGAGATPLYSPEAHDQAVAACSHAVQASATCLAGAVDATSSLTDPYALAAGGWRDTTRVAASTSSMWVPILTGNAAHVSPILREIAARLTLMADAAESADIDTIQRLFTDGNRARIRWAASRDQSAQQADRPSRPDPKRAA